MTASAGQAVAYTIDPIFKHIIVWIKLYSPMASRILSFKASIVIQMSASAGHAVAYTIGPIFKHIIVCVKLYFTNGFTNIVLWSVNCHWLVGVILIFDGTPQIIVQRCQIAATKWPNDISSAADNAIFKNRALNIDCSFGCISPMASRILSYEASIVSGLSV